MTEADMVAYAEDKGIEDGMWAAPYSPPVRWCISDDADDAYMTAYWYAFAYLANPFVSHG